MINLKKTGDSISLEKKDTLENVAVKMLWKSAIDLDLHAKVVGVNGNEEHVYYSRKGSLSRFPYTQLDQDAGVGNTGGDNEENMKISKLDELKNVLLYVENFGNSRADFARYGARLQLKFATKEIEIDMNDPKIGKYFVIARIKDGEVTCINKTVSSQPSLNDFDGTIVIDQALDIANKGVEKGKGLLRRLGSKLANL